MTIEMKKKFKKVLLQGLKIGMGSSIAIYLAVLCKLDYAISAGSITLLTIVSTKWDTVKLSLFRVITMILAIAMACLIFSHLHNEWIAYGIFVFIMVIICELLGWGATISVNAVIGAHFLMELDFSLPFILNECLLVIIGITVAVVLNLFYDYRAQESTIIRNMRYTEQQLQMLLKEMAAFLSEKEMKLDVWEEIRRVEDEVKTFVQDAYDYQNNTFHSHPGYYVDYFEMRMQQVKVLYSLQFELNKIRTVPKQAQVIAEYISYLTDYVIEVNAPTKQIERLNQIFLDMKKEPMPVTRDEFENRAMLFHILMDLEEFLKAKKYFVEALDEVQMKRYWNRH